MDPAPERAHVVHIYLDGTRRVRVRLASFAHRPRTVRAALELTAADDRDVRTVRVRTNLSPVLREAVARKPHRDAIVPVYLDVVRELAHLPWSRLFFELVDADLRRQLLPIWLPPRSGAGRQALTLPLQFVVTDEGAQRALYDIKERAGLSKRGVGIVTGDEKDAVVVTSDPGGALLQIAALEFDARPRLVIGPAHAAATAGVDAAGVPDGVSVALVPFEPVAVREMVVKIMHDEPLHEAVGVHRDAGAQLWATPASARSLRLGPARQALLDRLLDVEMRFPEGERPAVTTRVRDLPITFDRERNGLDPIAAGVVELERLALPQPLAAGTAPPRRLVDIRLERTGDTFVETPAPIADRLWVDKTTALRAGARYTLRFQIGRSLDGSLIVGDRTPLDTALPPPDAAGHELEVVVFPHDFELRSPAIVPLRLPRSGPSAAVRFGVVAPTMPTTERPARLRVAVYQRNNLAQSFLLTARVDSAETWQPHDVTTVRQDFSRTADFTDTERLPARPFSIAINGAGATHEMMIKGDKDAMDIQTSETKLATDMASFRNTLTALTYDRFGGPRYPMPLPPASPAAALSATFRSDLFQLASAGRKLFQRIYHRRVDVAALLDRLCAIGDDDVLQVVRLDADYAFPWTAVYDFDLPATEPADLCFGLTRTGARCGHTRADRVLCIRGFWGVRFVVEELIDVGQSGGPQSQPQPAAPSAIRIAADPAVCPPTALAQPLAQLVGAAVVEECPHAESPIDFFFARPEPPALFVAVGHHETQSRGRAPPPTPPYIQTPGYFEHDRMLQACLGAPWAKEQPVVVLMACRTAHDGHAPSTWALPLVRKGAAAVVVTEADVFSDFAGDVARRLCSGLLQKSELGRAMRELRVDLLRRQNPLGFVLVAFGDATFKFV